MLAESWVVGRRQSCEDWEQNVPRRRNNKQVSGASNRGVVEEGQDGPGGGRRRARGRAVGGEI